MELDPSYGIRRHSRPISRMVGLEYSWIDSGPFENLREDITGNACKILFGPLRSAQH